MKSFPFARWSAAAMAALLFLTGEARASIAYGSINNFDTVNDTGHECHGFEIELDDCHSTDVTYTYDYNHYGTPKITEDNSVPGHPKCVIRWESKKNPDGTWAAYTAIPSGPISPTNGHMFTNPSVNFGGEHFGVGYRVQPTAVRYCWLIDNGSGTLVNGGNVQVSTPSFTYYPPVVLLGNPAPAQVQAVIAPPPPRVPEPKEFGKALWVKEIRTTTHNNREVKLRDLVSDDPDDADDRNWRNDEPDEVETEWEILQKDYSKADGGVNNKKPAEAEDLPDGDEVVTRRYEFYKYVGPLDDESGEAMADVVGPDGIHGEGIAIVNGVETDLSTVVVVGDFTGSQMAAVDVDAPVGLIDHVSEGKVGEPYAARSLVIEGAVPFGCIHDGVLPVGMTFNEDTGILSGTPAEAGDFAFTVTASDGIAPDVSKNYTLQIAAMDAALPAESLLDTTASPVDSGLTTGDGSYAPGTEVTVEAVPLEGFRFLNWTDNGTVVSSQMSHTFVMDVNHSLVAQFVPDLPQWTINLGSAPAEGGVTTGGGLLDEGSDATITATAAPGFAFSNWTEGGVVVATSASHTFTVAADRSLVANFTPLPSYVVDAVSAPLAAGTITGAGSYFSGSSATVTAIANPGYVFLKWTSGSNTVSTAPAYTFTVNGARNLTANFVVAGTEQTITTSASPLAGGTVTGGGIYAAGDTATVVATPADGYVFTRWRVNGATVSTLPEYSFVVSANSNLVANFERRFVVNVSASPSFAGLPEMDSVSYKSGESARARANPEPDFTFVNWTENGVVVSSDETYDFDVTSDRALVANYASDFGVTIITHSSSAVQGSAAGEGVYNIGDAVLVSALPNEGYAFKNWTVDGAVVSTDADHTFIADGNLTLTANFAPAITVTASSSPSAGGWVNGAGGYAAGAMATLEAVANPDFIFRSWMENGVIVSSSPVYTFEVTAARDLVANFSPAYTITASGWPVGGGTVAGASTIAEGSSITLVAAPTEGYSFENWTDAGGAVVSTSPSFTFTPSASGDYTANFSAGLAGVHFNFDSGIPLLDLHTAVPFSQTVGGLTASFSSPAPDAPMIETEASTGHVLSKFAAHFLAPPAADGTVIEIQFDQAVAGVSFNFATMEDAAVAVGSNITLTATDNSTGVPIVIGTALAHGSTVPGDSFPTGTLTFNSGVDFDSIRIEIADPSSGATKLLIDNLIVSPSGSTGSSMLLANPNWNITLTDYGYSDYLLDNTPGFEGREYLSGEWGSAVSYVKDGVPVKPTWLEPQFLYPDWKTNSDFRVVQGIHLVASNADGLPIAESIITNDDLEITLRFEMVDTVTGTPMGVKPASAGSPGASVDSNRYVLNQSFKVRNISGASISGVRIYQLMHGLTSQHGVYDNRLYAGKLSPYRYDATLAGVDAGAVGSNSSSIGLEDFIAFHSKVAPAAFEIGHYGIEGTDDHSTNKPSDGVHLSIEENWAGLPYETRRGRDEFSPSHRWIAGGQSWTLGDLAAGQSSNFDIVLSLLTGTKVVREGGGGGNHGHGSCNGGSSYVGGVDFSFDDITVEGTFFGEYSEADEVEMAERENEGDFSLPLFPRPEGSTITQLWNLEYSGTHNGPIHLTFAYDPALLPAGFDERKLTIYHFNGSIWEKLGGTVNTVAHTITVTTGSLSPFALGARILPVADAASAVLGADAVTPLVLTGSAPSGLPPVFEITGVPAHGLLSGFNSATGAVIYTPVHGFHGTDAFSFRVIDGPDASDPATFSLTVSAPLDSDGDGMPDTWEQSHFNHPTAGDPAIDSDGDGLTNAQEYSANSSPVDASSVLRSSQVSCDETGHLSFTWNAVGGVRYRVQYSDDLAGGFTDIVRPIDEETDASPNGSPSSASFTDDFTRTGGAPGNGARFYRVKVVP